MSLLATYCATQFPIDSTRVILNDGTIMLLRDCLKQGIPSNSRIVWESYNKMNCAEIADDVPVEMAENGTVATITVQASGYLQQTSTDSLPMSCTEVQKTVDVAAVQSYADATPLIKELYGIKSASDFQRHQKRFAARGTSTPLEDAAKVAETLAQAAKKKEDEAERKAEAAKKKAEQAAEKVRKAEKIAADEIAELKKAEQEARTDAAKRKQEAEQKAKFEAAMTKKSGKPDTSEAQEKRANETQAVYDEANARVAEAQSKVTDAQDAINAKKEQAEADAKTAQAEINVHEAAAQAAKLEAENASKEKVAAEKKIAESNVDGGGTWGDTLRNGSAWLASSLGESFLEDSAGQGF